MARRTEAPNVVTSFPWCGKAIVAGPNHLTNHQGENQHMMVRIGVDSSVTYRPLGNEEGQELTDDFVAGEYIPCWVTHVTAADDDTGMKGFF